MQPTTNLATRQWIVGLQIAASIPFQLAFVWWGLNVWEPAGPPSGAMADRLAYAAIWILPGTLALLAVILFIAGFRTLRIDTIDGDPAAALGVHLRVLRNTVEQWILMASAQLTLATQLPVGELPLLPVLSMLFVVARGLFWAGYAAAPRWRGFGFAATVCPNAAALVLAAWLAFGG